MIEQVVKYMYPKISGLQTLMESCHLKFHFLRIAAAVVSLDLCWFLIKNRYIVNYRYAVFLNIKKYIYITINSKHNFSIFR